MAVGSQETALGTLSAELAGAVELAGRSIVAIHARRRIPASGVVWRDGIIVAADHTIRRQEGITVTTASGTSVEARLAGRDPSTDLALLRAEGSPADLRPATLGDGSRLTVGRLVLALGRPGRDVTASFGIISAVGGEWRTWQGGRIDRLIRLDLNIYDGFSGGPLVDASGEVLGIDTSGLTRGAPVAVPVATVDRVVDQLMAHGRMRRGYLGLALQPVRIPESLQRAAKTESGRGLMVIGVEGGGPAERSGVLVGDILLTADGRALNDPRDVLAHLAGDRIGATISVEVIRGGVRKTMELAVGERAGDGR